MSRTRKYAAALALIIAFSVNGAALAAPRGDDGGGPDVRSRIKAFIVRILEEIRQGIPGG